ncbi:hypothetical protein BSKO_11868 [Bryopsis sp. KO-2023]|nr:hypothetical protein BSKO_11868 [Bryopsis sp. KO-2023]
MHVEPPRQLQPSQAAPAHEQTLSPALLALTSPVPGANEPGPSAQPLQDHVFPVQGGHQVRFFHQAGRWQAIALECFGVFSRKSVLPVCCQGHGDVAATLQALQGKPEKYVQQHIHLLLAQQGPHFIYLGTQGLKGGMQHDAGAGGSRPCRTPARDAQGGNASMSLRNRMAKEDISSTEALVDALNLAKKPKDRAALQEWVRAYIEWFDREPVGILTQRQGIALKEYSLLAGIQPGSAGQKEVLREYFDSLHRKFQEDRLGSRYLIEALEYTLQAIDIDVFEGDPTSMFQLGNEFLAKLDPTRIIFTKAAYPTHRSTLHALHHTLMLIRQIAPSQLDPMQEDGLYSRFRARVEAIVDNAQYYPVCYHGRLLQQSLQRLASAGNQVRIHDGLRRARKGLKGVIFFYKSVKALTTLDFDIESFEAGYESWKAAFTSQHVKSKPWYDWHLAMQHACRLNLEDTNQYHVFSECLQGTQEKEASLRNPADRKVLRFGLVQQLCLLALEGATAEVRLASVEKLASLAHSCNIPDRGCWLEDLDILEELLEGLAAIAVHGQGEVEKEDAGVALEILTSSTLVKAAVQEAVAAWLGDQTLEEKLSTLPAPGAKPVLDVLFKKMNASLRQAPGGVSQVPDLGGTSWWKFKKRLAPASMQEVCQELRAYYLHDNFAQVRSLFDGRPPKHVDSVQCQLMLIQPVKADKPQDSIQGACLDHLGTHYERMNQVRTPISMEELFQNRSTQPGKPAHEIHKVLLVGNPGTGKTTLSRKLAYRWANGTWGQGFEAVWVLPVRALQQSAYDNVSFRRDETLANAIVKNCFGPREDDDYKRLRHQISQMLNKPTTLVVLDGLDERYGASEQLIDQAKSGAHKLLILSRPYGIEVERSLADIEIEHAGFNDTQLEAFVNQELSLNQGAELLAFIREQSAIASIAHVPVNLQILCALWRWQDKGEGGGAHAVPMNGSLSGLYGRLTGYVWHRYKEKHRGQHLQDQDCEALFDALGQIAVCGLECGEVLLSQGLVDGVLIEGEGRVREMLKDAGFLLLQDLGKQYQFPHLTFQEYFAGCRLAKQFMSKEPRERGKAEKFFSNHKYEHQFRGTFSFMAGEVSKRGEVEEIMQLFKLVDSEPREIIGAQHVLLQVRLLDEWLCAATSSGGGDLEKELAGLEEEFQVLESLTGWFQVGMELIRGEEFHGSELLDLLTAGLQGSRAVVANFPSLFEFLLDACEDSNVCVRVAALEALGNVISASGQAPTLLKPLSTGCADSQWNVRVAALEVLGKVVEVAPGEALTLLEPLFTVCADSEWNGRVAALEVVGKVVEAAPGEAPNLMQPLFNAFKESVFLARRDINNFVGKIVEAAPGEAPALLEPLLNASKDSDLEVRVEAVEALGDIIKAASGEVPNLLESLLNACKDSELEVRVEAVGVLGEVVEAAERSGEFPNLLESLLYACKDSELEVRVEAVGVLWRVAEAAERSGEVPNLLESLLNACKDSELEVRVEAVGVLGEVVEAAERSGEFPNLLESLLYACKDSELKVRVKAVKVLEKVVEAAERSGEFPNLLESLLYACKDSELKVRVEAVMVLEKVVEAAERSGEFPNLLESLLFACKDSELEVRVEAVEVLWKVAEVAPGEVPNLMQPLFTVCADSEWEVRIRAVIALGKALEAAPKDNRTLLEPLLRASKDSKLEVRVWAVRTLGRVVEAAPKDNRTLLEPLLRASKDSKLEVRAWAVHTLGRVVEAAPGEVPTFLEPFLNACQDSEELVRSAAVRTLGTVVQAAPGEVPTFLEPFLNACQDSEKGVRSAAVHTIGKIIQAAPRQVPTFLEPLLNACNDSDWYVRSEAVRALGKALKVVPKDTPTLLEPLLRASKDSDENVRHLVANRLGKLPLQQLMDGYWATHSPTCIPTIVAKLFRMPLSIQNSPKRHHQRLVLYPSAGQVFKWDIPKKEVQPFLQQIQRAARRGVS